MVIASEPLPAAARRAPRADREPRSVYQTINGLRLHHLEWGPTDGRPLVLIHGIRAHARVWTRPAAHLTPPYRLLAPDLRGHGDSEWSDEGYGTPRYVSDFQQWVDNLGLAEFDLIGHSAGGRSAAQYAARHPTRVSRLVIIDMGPDVPIPRFDPKLAALGPSRFPSIDVVASRLRERYPTVSTRYLQQLARWSVRAHPDGVLMWKWDIRVRGQPPNAEAFRDELRALQCPTLVIHGGQRAYLRPEWAANMVALIPTGRLAALPDTGHCLAEERPARFAALVRPFLAEA